MLVSERRTFITPRGYKYSFIYVPARDSKTTLLFLHGFPSQADDWERQVAHFAPLGYGVIAPDLLGYGDTSKPDALTSYTFKGMSDDIAQLLDHLRVESVVGVGHDFGANFLGRLAAYHRARFQALVFLAVGSGKPAQKFDVEAIQQMTKKMAGFVMFGYLPWLGGKEDPHGVLEEHARSAMSLLFAADNSAWRIWLHPLGAMKQFVTEDKQIPVGKWYTSAMQDRHLEIFGARDGYKGATRWYRMLVTNASLEEEQSIAETSLEQPSIIVADAQSMPPQMGMLAEWVPNLTPKELESGHWTHIECAEQVNQIITEHIEALGARELWMRGNGRWKKFLGSSSVALKDIRYVGLYDYSAGLGISGDRWEFQGLKLRGQCAGKNKQVEVDKFASVNKYLQHSNKNKGNPWIFQMPFFPKVDDGLRGTAGLVWAGNMTVDDWKATGARDEKQKGEKETAQFCFSEGGSEECNEGSDKDKYTKGPAQAS